MVAALCYHYEIGTFECSAAPLSATRLLNAYIGGSMVFADRCCAGG